jgi:hypothetical protein
MGARGRDLLLVLVGLTLAGYSAVAGPAGEADDPNVVVAVGTTVHVQARGGAWGILADDGTLYQPFGLPPEFRRLGLRVWFAGRLVLVYCPTWGTPLSLQAIRRLEGGPQ